MERRKLENKVSGELTIKEEQKETLNMCHDTVIPDDYRIWSRTTAIYPKDKAIDYLIIALCGETGELANKYKKILRDENGVISDERKEEIKCELGGIYYYLARLSDEMNIKINDVLKYNIEQLNSRKERGVLSGSGDNR